VAKSSLEMPDINEYLLRPTTLCGQNAGLLRIDRFRLSGDLSPHPEPVHCDIGVKTT